MKFRPQFRLRSLFILTAVVAAGCLVGPPTWRSSLAAASNSTSETFTRNGSSTSFPLTWRSTP